MQKFPNVVQSFQLWCIETVRQPVPPYIHRVPTIAVIKGARKLILADTAAFAWLAEQTKQQNIPVQAVDSSMIMGTNISSRFSDLTGKDNEVKQCKAFFCLQDDPQKYAIHTLDTEEETRPITMNDLDSIRSRREQDMQRYGMSSTTGKALPGSSASFDVKQAIDLSKIQEQRKIQGNQWIQQPPQHAPCFQTFGTKRLTTQDMQGLLHQGRPEFEIPKQEKIDFKSSIYS